MAINRPTKAALLTTEKLFDRILCVAGAVLCSQAPEFMQQYLQRLGGALGESRRHLEQYHQAARESNQSLQQLVEAHRASPNAGVAKSGDVIESTSARVAELSAAETAIREASPISRPFVFAQHYDAEIGDATWTVFKPAVPTTLEGALYAGVGLVFLLGIYHGLVRYPVSVVYQKRKARKEAAVAARSAPPGPPPTAPPAARPV